MERQGDYFYEHKDGSILRKPAFVVDMGGGPRKYFDSPFVVRWWQGDDPEKRESVT